MTTKRTAYNSRLYRCVNDVLSATTLITFVALILLVTP
jgi:hypothetical protein